MNEQAETPHQMVVTEKQIRNLVTSIAKDLDALYCHAQPHLLVVLNAAYIFAADLSRQMAANHTIGFVKVASYKDNTRLPMLQANLVDHFGTIADKDVIIVDTFTDTGRTLCTVYDQLRVYAPLPRSITTATLFTRTTARRPPTDHTTGDFIPHKGWLVGYGLDNKQYNRNRRYIVAIDPLHD